MTMMRLLAADARFGGAVARRRRAASPADRDLLDRCQHPKRARRDGRGRAAGHGGGHGDDAGRAVAFSHSLRLRLASQTPAPAAPRPSI